MLKYFKANSNKSIIYNMTTPWLSGPPFFFSSNENADVHLSRRQINTLFIDQNQQP